MFRFLLGMGEAGNWPAAVKVVAEWFPERERALASGLFNAGSSVGAILAPPVVAVVLLRFGWRTAFVAIGVVGFIWLLLWWPVYHTPGPAGAKAAAPPEPVWQLFRTRFVWSFTLSKVFMDPVWYFYIFWFPEYLKQRAELRSRRHRHLFLDPVRGGGRGQSAGRLAFGIPAGARLQPDRGAQSRR